MIKYIKLKTTEKPSQMNWFIWVNKGDYIFLERLHGFFAVNVTQAANMEIQTAFLFFKKSQTKLLTKKI